MVRAILDRITECKFTLPYNIDSVSTRAYLKDSYSNENTFWSRSTYILPSLVIYIKTNLMHY